MEVGEIIAYKSLNARIKNSPSSVPDFKKNQNINIISNDFTNSLSYEEIALNDSVEKSPVHILSNGKIPTIKSIVMYPGLEIKAGDKVTQDSGSQWICLHVEDNSLYSKGKIEKCNFDLKWIDQDGFIQTFPSILYFNARSNFGTEEDKVMNLPAGRRNIAVSKNANTQSIQRDARFIIGSEAFKVIDTDYMSDDGLVNLSLQSDQIDPVKDNLELGIADYHNLGKYELHIHNDNPLSLSINQSARINVRVIRNGSEISDPQLEYSSSNTDLISVDEQGIITIHESGETIITVSAYGIEKQLNIYVAPTIHYDYAATIDGANDIYLNRESTYVANFYNNGLQISDESSFSLTNLDGSPTLLASISSQDPIANTCVVKANSNRKLGTVILHVKNSNGLSNGQKEIKIKSLI
ncbi:Ig-like domain-containing protein [Paenibacillus sp. USHLN196]|uniref:Ig-like domain-containing protein n=1 Tax=Paenibacillus sp. USHLN196 TaxID=3081291 RepID=UPI003015DE03